MRQDPWKVFVIPIEMLRNRNRLTLSLRVQQPIRDVRIELWGDGRRLTGMRQRVCVPGEMVKWPVERAAFADCRELRVTAKGEAF